MQRHPILRWITKEERRKIMKEFGIKSDQHIYNIANLKSNNYPVLQKVVELAEHNKMLTEKATNFSKV